jgi:TRAP-type C4-dicarboxylate transport system substrate-binding protein
MSVMTFSRRLGAAAFGLALGVTGAAQAQTEWDLPLAWPDGNFHVANAKVFAAEVEKATKGAVKINIHPGGSLGFKGPEMLTAVRDGLVPIGDALLIQQTGEQKIFGLEAQPYMVKSLEELQILHKYFVPAISKIAEEQYNQKILYVVPWPRQYVYTKVMAKSVDDLKGIKIRTYNSSTTDMFNRVGMTSVQLPWGEVVPSLAAGTIDAVTTSASSGVDGKFWEFLKYMYPTSHVWSSNMVAVNLDAWNALSEDNRTAILNVAERLEPRFWDVSRGEDDAKVKILTDNGVMVGEVTDGMLSEMQKLTAPMTDEYIAGAGSQAGEIIKAFLKDVGRM